ncbi:MAG: ribose-phosphate pyrophosphokinase [Spirochaetales bacterium]|nr:ribose-phosphate pyrophosphokinase [Spirochaetales bacterium]
MDEQQHERQIKDGGFTIPKSGARDDLVIAACASATELAGRIVDCYRRRLAEGRGQAQVRFLDNLEGRFKDSETRIRIDCHIGGSDVFLIQQLLDPVAGAGVNQNYLAFLIAARAFREHGAGRITAVLPYLAYARQDKPTKYTREATTAQLMAELSLAAGIDRLISWAPHSSQIHGFYGAAPIHLLDPQNLFLSEFERFRGREEVIVTAPDAGAAKLATHFSREMDCSCALASKYRPQPENVEISEIIGDFSGKRVAIIIDDMIASGGTIYELAGKLIRTRGIEELYIGVGHNLCLTEARERLEELYRQGPLKALVTTDSVPQTEEFRSLPFVKIHSLNDILCRTINRVHYDRSVSELFLRE